MKKHFIVGLTAALLTSSFSPSIALSQLSKDAIVRLYEEKGPGRDNPYYTSFRDGVNAGVDHLVGLLGTGIVSFTVQERGFRKQGLKVGASILREQCWSQPCRPKRAPLVVYFAGLTQGASHPYSEWVRYIANASGAHFAAIPGAFSADYLAADPIEPTATYHEEARVAHQVLAQIREKVGEKYITEVQFVGLSYGSFIAMLVGNLGVKSLTKLTLFSLPVSMKEIIHSLDRLMDESLHPYPWDFGIGGAVYWSRFGASSDAEQRLKEAKRYFAWTFQTDQIVNAVDLGVRFGCAWPKMNSALAAFPQMGKLPISSANFPQDAELFRRFAEEVRFWKTIELCTPKNLAFYDSWQDSAPDWLGRLDPSLKIDIVSSKDDPIIDVSKWFAFRPSSSNTRYIELPHGGHNGFFYSNWFKVYLSDRIR